MHGETCLCSAKFAELQSSKEYSHEKQSDFSVRDDGVGVTCGV